METITDNTIAEIDTAIDAESITPTEPTPAAPVDVTALRAEIEADRRDLADKELRLAEAELDQAVSVHSNLCEQSNAAQITYDELDRKVNLAQQAFYQTATKRDGVTAELDMRRRNTPEKRFGNAAIIEAWNAELSRLGTEQETASRQYGESFSILNRLQSERSAAANSLSDVSWRETQARNGVAALRAKLDSLTPPKPRTEVESHLPQLNGATLALSGDSAMRSDVVTRRAATREPADTVLLPG